MLQWLPGIPQSLFENHQALAAEVDRGLECERPLELAIDDGKSMVNLTDVLCCPTTGKITGHLTSDALSFDGSERTYRVYRDVVDFVGREKDAEFGYLRAKETWGANLHADGTAIPARWHHDDMQEMFAADRSIYDGRTILEIGCGQGFDLRNAGTRFPEKSFVGVDLGENVLELGHRDRGLANVNYVRGDALHLPLRDEAFDSVVSFGVFHHTPAPKRCMQEAARVLRPGGSICLYLYKDHEDNPVKYAGVLVESALMTLTKRLPLWAGKLLCWAMVPIVLLLFSWPAQILKRFRSTRRLGKKFPLHWGTGPASIIADLEDRLLAPVNYRYSRKGFEELFTKHGFEVPKIVTTSGGHFGLSRKRADSSAASDDGHLHASEHVN